VALELRNDERQWLRYAPDEAIGAMRAAEAWSMMVAGNWLAKRVAPRLHTEAAEKARHVGSIMAKVGKARMDYLGSGRYEQPLEVMVGASGFDVLSRLTVGENIMPEVLDAALDSIEAALTHIDSRTSEAGFMHPTRLESVLTRGDA